MEKYELDEFTEFCTNMIIATEGVGERISNRLKSTRKDVPIFKSD